MQHHNVSVFLLYAIVSCLLFNFACTNLGSGSAEKAKQSILSTEKEFERMAAEKGIAQAFEFYADENVVISRNDSIIKGKLGIRKFYSNPVYSKSTLRWSADHVEVSSSNDLGYTYGKYVFTVKDTGTQFKQFKGLFHTVWRKQKDGSWRFVYD